MSSPLLLIFVVTAFWIFSVVTPYQTGMQKRMTDPVTICTVFPHRVNSLGLWNKSDAWPVHVKDPLGIVHFTFRLQNYTLPILEFEITLIYVLTQLTHLFLKLFGLPVFAAQLLAGLLLGDLGLDRMVRHSSRGFSLNPIFPFPNQEVLNIISLSGYTLFTFLFGVKMDVGLVYKTGRKAIYTGVLTLIVPLIAATATLLILTFQWSLQAEEIVQLLFITSLHSLSPSPVIHCLLTELRILNSELGRLALSSALVSDVSSISLTGVSTIMTVMQQDPDKPLIDLTMMIVFTLFVYYVCRPVMLWMVRKTPEGKSVKDSYILIILLAVFGSGLISHAALTAFWIFSVVTPYQTGMQKRMTDPVTICTVFPHRVNSLGLWNKSDAWPVHVKDPLGIVHFTFRLQNYTLPILEFEITLIYVLTQLTHLFLKLFGLPVFAAQLLAGLLLGDLGLDRMVRHSSRGFSLNPIFPFPNQEVLNIISLSGYTLFTFLFGVKMDVGLVYKTGRKAIYTGVLTLIVPLIAATATLLILTFQWSLQAEEIVQLLFITSLHSLSPSPVIHCLLTELRILNSELGRLALSSALVSDVSSISLTGVSTIMTVMQQDPDKPLIDLTMMIVFTLFVHSIFAKVEIVVFGSYNYELATIFSQLFCCILRLSSSYVVDARLSIVVGPLILGLAVPDGPPLGATLVRKLDFMINRVFMPVFVTTSMMRVVVHQEVPDGDQTAVRATAIITLVIFLSKFVASLVTPLCCKMPLKHADDREALTFAKRMVKDACISLTVIHLVDASDHEESHNKWEWVQDNEMLKEVKQKSIGRDACISLTVIHLVDASDHEESHNKWEWVQDNEMLKEVKQKSIGYVSYVEENVQDGTQTTRKIRSLMDDDEYDLFIVGRRYKVKSPQTLGLEDWSEFPELGVIGDMLSSADFRCKSSVLVVQQQQQRRR
ncbi:hypothetical protein C1H46_013637 [Malus baccata]|uniref:Cation/H+ exchanger transmembrane domain-containing protein n=1 Tax=Malus baccata TaxID=106549 RepID=A0A540MPH7_MALBA|nr:hypothetical protein C1H46_013637 [Malus baccata]